MLIKIHWLKNVREFMLYREEKKTPLCIIYLLYWPPRHLFSLICICPPPPHFAQGDHPSFCICSGWDSWSWCPLLLSLSGYVIQDWPKKFSFPGGWGQRHRSQMELTVLWGGTLQTRFSSSCYLEPQSCPDSPSLPRFGFSDFLCILQTIPRSSNKLFCWLN